MSSVHVSFEKLGVRVIDPRLSPEHVLRFPVDLLHTLYQDLTVRRPLSPSHSV